MLQYRKLVSWNLTSKLGDEGVCMHAHFISGHLLNVVCFILTVLAYELLLAVNILLCSIDVREQQ
jgi:hypothetical protein